MSRLVDADNIRRWAYSAEAVDLLPRLVQRLVLVTGFGRVVTSRFPAGKGTGLGDFDGVTELTSNAPFVPGGVTVWELSTQENPEAKADSDYVKRKTDPAGIDRESVSYIAVTARSWGNCESWALDRDKEEIWRQVRAIDAHGLAAWLELAPPVNHWFSWHLGAIPTNTLAVDTWWLEWRTGTDPELSTTMLLAGRQDHARDLRGTLRQPGGKILGVAAETQEDALAFVVAALAPSDSQPGDADVDELHAARALVIEDLDAFRQASRSKTPSILIPTVDVAEYAGSAKAAGHVVILPRSRDLNSEDADLKIPALDPDAITVELLSGGLDRERAAIAARSCREGIEALRRHLAAARSPYGPEWARPPLGPQLAVLMLAGGWDEARSGDFLALSTIAGREETEVRELLRTVRYLPGSPFKKSGTVWRLRTPMDAWDNLSRYIDTERLEVLREVAVGTLGAPDPRFELPEERRWAGPVYGKEPLQSAELRHGLAQTLAILGAMADRIQLDSMESPESWACAIVRDVLSGATWQVWASLGNELTLLAEACPDRFLGAVEQASSDDGPLAALFVQTAGGPLPTTFHAPLIMAIQRLLWPSAHRSRAAICLARLAQLDPGGNHFPRPLDSLIALVSALVSNVLSAPEEVLRIIESLRIRYPDVAWRVMLAVATPVHSGIHHGLSAPQWRPWLPKEQSDSTV